MKHEHYMNNHNPHHHAGLQHLEQLSQANARHHEHEIEHTDREKLAVERDFTDHEAAHDISYRNVDGFETSTFPIASQIDTAHHYLGGAIVGLIVAVVIGVWFALMTIVTTSYTLLVLGSALVAGIVGVGASLVFRVLFGATTLRPAAMRHVNAAIAVSGIAFAILLTLFLWLRFNSDSWLAHYISTVMVGLELTALLFAGACDCGYRVYRWSAKLHRRHRKLVDRKAVHENALAEENATLRELRTRLHFPAPHHPSTPPSGETVEVHHVTDAPHKAEHHNGTYSDHQEVHHANAHSNSFA